jgi:Polyketide cyclase / dehydrase and lipid transport
MVKRIAIAVVILLAAFLAYAASQPDTFQVERNADINAVPQKIFAQINDFHNWMSWSPWERIDPKMTRTYSGSASGKGAIYEWDGNDQVGKGRMEIIESSPSSKIAIKLDFIKPFEGHNIAEFTLRPEAKSTNVTWSMHGHNPYMAKVLHLFFNCDRMIGKSFEQGLASLKAVAQK